MRKKLAAANWKMNLTLDQSIVLINQIKPELIHLNSTPYTQVLFAVPFPLITTVQNLLAGCLNVFVAAQNCYQKLNGAYTGEVSAELLESLNVKYVIVGHSERRQIFNESNSLIKEKIDILLSKNISPIFCCGESLEIRESGQENEFVLNQLEESLFHLTPNQFKNIVIAYEPIWAIGTGKTATNEQAQAMHKFIRSKIANKYSNELAQEITILYGGSVKGNNAKEIFKQEDVDGGLIGGASLNSKEFSNIIKALI